MSYKSVVCEFQIIYVVYSPQGFAVTYPVLSRTSFHDRTTNLSRRRMGLNFIQRNFQLLF